MAEFTLPGSGRVVTVDDGDLHVLEAFRWEFNIGYVRRPVRDGKKVSSVYLHRAIMEATAKTVVDHIDGNPLNNRRENLRLCKQGDNVKNKRVAKNTKSGYKGVYATRGGKWYAQIKSDGERENLGTFDSKEEAARAYDRAAARLHGEFARLNFSAL